MITVLEPFASLAETAAQAAKVMASAMQSSRVEELQSPKPAAAAAAPAPVATGGPPAIPTRRKISVRITGIEERSEPPVSSTRSKSLPLASNLCNAISDRADCAPANRWRVSEEVPGVRARRD